MNHRNTFPSLRALLFPPRCVTCGDLLHPGATCAEAFCPLCRAAWETAMAEAAESTRADAARGLVYLTFYRGSRANGIPERLIYHLKHYGDPRAFAFVAERLAPRILEAAERLPTRADGVAPRSERLPLLFTYPPRRASAIRTEGFDQAERLTKALSEACGGEFLPLIRRTRLPAREQKELDAAGRAANADLSYELTDDANAVQALRGRVVVICDDICTTGATLNRCAHLLVEAGAALVISATVAHNQGNGNSANK